MTVVLVTPAASVYYIGAHIIILGARQLSTVEPYAQLGPTHDFT